MIAEWNDHGENDIAAIQSRQIEQLRAINDELLRTLENAVIVLHNVANVPECKQLKAAVQSLKTKMKEVL